MLKPQYDGKIDIATSSTRRNRYQWKNKEVNWSWMLERMAETHRTAETYAEYMAAEKGRQAEIKDVGGFVGGYLSGGRRKSGSVLHRQLITLDLDFVGADFWEDFKLLYGNAAAIYSTHKHNPKEPRFRLVLPLDRHVFADQYEAIARKIAGLLGIELFDPSTFQPERLMYWPSTSKDAEYFFQWQDGPWLSADAVLGSYVDWKDSSAWPVSVKVGALVKKSMVKQGDPLEKPGLIGAFCRTYGIHDTIITYLSDVYEPCDVEDRYTYLHGSTAAGLVVYEDKWVYSHHGTDPTNSQLCNAFDLVRLHKFGLKDEDAKPGTPINKLPSFLAMCDLASADNAVRREIVEERLADVRNDFAGVEMTEEADGPAQDDSWKDKLDIDRKGNVYSTIDNVLLIMENDNYFKGRIAFDDFEKCEVAVRQLPWRKVKLHNSRPADQDYNRRLTDRDHSSILHYLEKVYGINHESKTNHALAIHNERTAFHPVKEYLNGLNWDGVERLDSLYIDYMGAEDSAYTRAVTRKGFTAAVARIFEPGIKYDTMPVLVGPQGTKKSSLFDRMGGAWFSDDFSFNVLARNETRAIEQLQGSWIVEIPELSGLAKIEIESVKHFIAKRVDRFRVAYGHKTEIFPRQWVPFASVNKLEFLKDQTGNRRFNPVRTQVQTPTKDVTEDLTKTEVDQVWAEAVHRYRRGEKLYLEGGLAEVAVQVQKEHTEEHPWFSIVQNYLDTKLPADWLKMDRMERRYWVNDGDKNKDGVRYRSRVCLPELWHEALNNNGTIDEKSANVLKMIMGNMEGWERGSSPKKHGIYGVQRNGFFRSNMPEEYAEKADWEGAAKGVVRG